MTTPTPATASRASSGASEAIDVLSDSGKLDHQVEVMLRAQLVSFALGGAARLAEVVGVDRSRATRWKQGKGLPSAESEAKLLTLDYVLARARLVWSPQAAIIWLESPNYFLNGSRPLDVLDQRGSGPVVSALEAELSGAFA